MNHRGDKTVNCRELSRLVILRVLIQRYGPAEAEAAIGGTMEAEITRFLITAFVGYSAIFGLMMLIRR